MTPLLFLGVGPLALAVRRSQAEAPAWGTTRSAPDARFAHISPLAADDDPAIRAAARGARVVVSFPPDAAADARFSALVVDAARVVYLSSTAVYSSAAATIDETSPVDAGNERAQSRLLAEAEWLRVGASIVRLPAFYGLTRGLHVSLARGSFRLPGDGSNVVSRVHEDDAARFVGAALEAAPGSVLIAGDDEPAPVAEVVAFVCEHFGLPPPAPTQGEAVPLSLRNSRRVDSRATRAKHQLTLAYPSYREGYLAVRRQLGGAK